MESFYGGQPGQHFKISKIFNSKVAMTADLSMRWQSSIGVGEYVFIAYGIPNDTGSDSYLANRDSDLNTYGETYNSTLWQKVYREQNVITNEYDELTGIEVYYIDGDYGFGYKLLASLTGNTPKVQVGQEYVTLEKPETYGYFTVTDIENYASIDAFPETGQANVIYVALDTHQTYEWKNNQYVETDSDLGYADIDSPVWTYHSPQTPEWLVSLANNVPESNVTLTLSKAWDETGYDPTTDDPNATFNFTFPRSAISTVAMEILDPSRDPTVNLVKLWQTDTSSSTQRFDFGIPRAVRFFYGNLLALHNPSAEVQAVPVASLPDDLRTGDYYINSTWGFIYLCTNIGETDTSFTYRGKFTAPVPNVTIGTLPTYTDNNGDWIITPPTVAAAYEDPTTETGYRIDLAVPQVPKLVISDSDFIGPDERGSVSGEVVSATVGATTADTYGFSFSIPRGARLFSGNLITTDGSTIEIPDAKVGDYYFNSNSGDVFKWNGTVWNLTANIKGPVGAPVQFITALHPQSQNVPTESEIKAYLDTQFPTDTPDPTQTIPVNWDIIATGETLSYWCNRNPEDTDWVITYMTAGGGVTSFLKSVYTTDPDETPYNAYTVGYTNSLISNTAVVNTQEEPNLKQRKTYSAEYIENLLTWNSF